MGGSSNVVLTQILLFCQSYENVRQLVSNIFLCYFPRQKEIDVDFQPQCSKGRRQNS